MKILLELDYGDDIESTKDHGDEKYAKHGQKVENKYSWPGLIERRLDEPIRMSLVVFDDYFKQEKSWYVDD